MGLSEIKGKHSLSLTLHHFLKASL